MKSGDGHHGPTFSEGGWNRWDRSPLLEEAMLRGALVRKKFARRFWCCRHAAVPWAIVWCGAWCLAWWWWFELNGSGCWLLVDVFHIFLEVGMLPQLDVLNQLTGSTRWLLVKFLPLISSRASSGSLLSGDRTRTEASITPCSLELRGTQRWELSWSGQVTAMTMTNS